ncbi:MAG: AMP-binding protein [Archangium sp.]|nr:AMP-binding protein [Archangium sp.]
MTFGSKGWTWREVDAEVGRAVAWLSTRGVQRNMYVVVASANRPELVFLFFACARLGAIFVPLNARLTPSERGALTQTLEPRIEISSLELPGNSAVADTEHAEPTQRGALESNALNEAARDEPAWSQTASPNTSRDEAAIDERSVAAGLFTSGTTATPRFVPLRHSQFIASARASTENLGVRPDDCWLGTLPLFHVGGLALVYRWALQATWLQLEPGFDVSVARAALVEGRVTHASLVPTMLQRVLAEPVTFSPRLRAVLIGGAAMSPELSALARARSLPVLQTYGLTEACSQVATERPAEADGTTSGPPLPGVEVRIVDGEIHVRGATVSAPEWFATGDLGELDTRGRLLVHSRRVDLIISGGENIAPAEIERLLARHPAIVEVAVVPRDDAEWGQVPVAVVVWRTDATPVLPWLRDQLAGFKRPRAVLSVPELPRNANGKIERRTLVDGVRSGAFPVVETT